MKKYIVCFEVSVFPLHPGEVKMAEVTLFTVDISGTERKECLGFTDDDFLHKQWMPESSFYCVNINGETYRTDRKVIVEQPNKRLYMDVARGIAARIWADRDMTECVMDAVAAEKIAFIINNVRLTQRLKLIELKKAQVVSGFKSFEPTV